MRQILGCGTAEAFAAARAVDLVQAFNAADWASFASRSRNGLLKDIARVRPSNSPDFASDERSVVLAGMHTGSLPLAVGWFSQNAFPGWPVFIVKTREGDADERGFFARLLELGVDVRLIIPGAPSLRHDLRDARSRSVIVCMSDLPPSYGRAASVDILWKSWSLATHYVDMARICDARLLFFASDAWLRHDDLVIEGPMDVDWKAADAVAEARQCIGRLIQTQLLRQPAQWHLWDRIDEYDVMEAA